MYVCTLPKTPRKPRPSLFFWTRILSLCMASSTWTERWRGTLSTPAPAPSPSWSPAPAAAAAQPGQNQEHYNMKTHVSLLPDLLLLGGGCQTVRDLHRAFQDEDMVTRHLHHLPHLHDCHHSVIPPSRQEPASRVRCQPVDWA